jgi:hypothetical protein
MRKQDRAQLSRILQEMVGKTVRSVRRVFFTYGGVVERNEGPLELEFADGSVALFQSGSNGQDLALALEPWRDPFGGEMSLENRSYVDQYGKWSAFDVSGDEPYVQICGNRILGVQEINLKQQAVAEGYPVDKAIAEGWDVDFETIVGAVISVGGRAIRVESIMDELHVDIVPNR